MARRASRSRTAPRSRSSNRRSYSARRTGRATSGVRRTAGRASAQTLRIVIEQPSASAVARPPLNASEKKPRQAAF